MPKRLIKLFLILFIPLFLLSVSTGWIVELLWLSELGYSQVFWVLKGTQLSLIVFAFAITALYLIPNFRTVASNLSHLSLAGTPFQQLNLDLGAPNQLKRVKQFFTLAALVIAGLFAIGFTIRWDETLRFLWNVPYGDQDPVFGRDIGFFMFQLPFWSIIQSSFTALTFLSLLVAGVIYLFSGRLQFTSIKDISGQSPAMNHLKLNAALWLLSIAAGYALSRFELLFKSDGLVFGAGYTDMTILLPSYWILILLTLLMAVILLVSRWVNLGKLLPYAAIATVLLVIVGQGVLPQLIQSFSVDPNELELETPYLEHNIEMTLLAYGLDNVEEVEYQADEELDRASIERNRDAIDNIRLWDPRLLIQTYKQLQEIRSYYEFYSVDNDRYMVDGEVVQMMLAAREIARELPSRSDTWVNRHMQYTHGYGVVMSPVTQTDRQGEPLFSVKDIPPVYESSDLSISNPAIYYGENSDGYYIVNTGVQELHYPFGDDNVYTNYSGSGGININSLFKRLLFAYELRDINILLSDYIQEGSRLQIWRSVQERISKITPFLKLDRDPYLVTSGGKLYWIQDAYTTSSNFPYAQPYGNINYIRNSVKVVVDAYEGSVNYYVVDEADPVLRVYQSIFPDLFQPVEALPEGMNRHFRYPQDLFEIQLQIFNRYHMTRPQVFYNQEDLWARPNEKYGGRQITMAPYYVLARLPGDETLEFMLISPLTPENRDNMIAWMTAKSDPESYGELLVYKLPKDRLIYGPAQIEAQIDQDPEISRQLALWDQRGSRVIRGNLMVIPVENSFLYVEPVFLLAEGVDIPQLQRVIVAVGDQVSMQPTLDAALYDLFGEGLPEDIVEAAQEIILTEEILTEEPPAGVSEDSFQQIRSLWRDLKDALEKGDWIRMGEVLDRMEREFESGEKK